MLSLLGGLLFRTRQFVEHIVQKPNYEQASRLSFFLIVMLMISTAFELRFAPNLYQDLIDAGLNDIAIWAIVFFLPPIQYVLQRWIFVFSARLGLAMFARNQLTRDPYEKSEQLKKLKMLYPYVIYPPVFFAFLTSPIRATVIGFMLSVIGLVYMFMVTVHGLHKIYGVSPTVAFWAPLLMHFLFFIALMIIVVIVVMILILVGVIPVAGL